MTRRDLFAAAAAILVAAPHGYRPIGQSHYQSYYRYCLSYRTAPATHHNPTHPLNTTLAWIRRNLSPDQVFSESQLCSWAEANGYRKETP